MSTKITGHEYLYPQSMTVDVHGNAYLYENYGSHTGITLRQHFAAMAMQGFIASYSGATKDPDITHCANKSVQYADALIKALNQ